MKKYNPTYKPDHITSKPGVSREVFIALFCMASGLIVGSVATALISYLKWAI